MSRSKGSETRPLASRIQIDPADRHPSLSGVAAGWLREQWDVDETDAVSMMLSRRERPAALLAFCDTTPIGVLTYKRYRSKSQRAEALWLNGLFVLPEFRGQGIARRLLEAGTCPDYVAPATRVFAYTDVPDLYTACGWKMLDKDNAGMHTFAFRIHRKEPDQ